MLSTIFLQCILFLLTMHSLGNYSHIQSKEYLPFSLLLNCPQHQHSLDINHFVSPFILSMENVGCLSFPVRYRQNQKCKAHVSLCSLEFMHWNTCHRRYSRVCPPMSLHMSPDTSYTLVLPLAIHLLEKCCTLMMF